MKYAELTNVTLNMLDIPSQITDINFEIIVVRLSINGTRENISTSPLDLGTVSPVQQARYVTPYRTLLGPTNEHLKFRTSSKFQTVDNKPG